MPDEQRRLRAARAAWRRPLSRKPCADGQRGPTCWHASDVELDGQTRKIQGSAALRMEEGAWRVLEADLLDVEQRAAMPDCQPEACLRPVAQQKRDAGDATETLN